MPNFNIVRETEVKDTFRNSRVCGMFDIPKSENRKFSISGNIDLPEDWHIGVIYGRSGSGKSTIAGEIFDVSKPNVWNDESIVENFDASFKVDDIVSALQSVGLSSPNTYLLPYSALSNGQKFRADLARTILENDQIVFDEFTSVVDRNVAKAACVAVSKYIRRTGKKFIAVSCHEDILEWLEPDWHFCSDNSRFSRDCLRRPTIEIRITKGTPAHWSLFHQHHYMTSSIHKGAQCYLTWAKLDDIWNLVGFFSTLPAMGMKGWRRGHRTVVLPDFQGLGIGNRMIELVAQYLWDTERLRFRATTSAPQIVKYRLKRPKIWRLVNGVESKQPSGNKKLKVKTSAGRLSTSWEYKPQKQNA